MLTLNMMDKLIPIEHVTSRWVGKSLGIHLMPSGHEAGLIDWSLICRGSMISSTGKKELVIVTNSRQIVSLPIQESTRRGMSLLCFDGCI